MSTKKNREKRMKIGIIVRGLKAHHKNISRFAKRTIFKRVNNLKCAVIPYERISCRTFEGALYVVRLFGRNTLYDYGGVKLSYKRKIESIKDKNNCIYLKVDRIAKYTFHCIQHWLDVANVLDYCVIVICDNSVLEKQILKKCTITENTIFIKSYGKEIKHIANMAFTGYWKKPAYAHITPFYHAYSHNIRNAWMIDGDDTSFLHKPEIVANKLKKVESLAESEKIDCISLDMWWSVTGQSHWTFGVAYFQDCKNIWETFNKYTESKEKWISELKSAVKTIRNIFNADDYINYFRVKRYLRVESFYIENARFMHWDDPFGSKFFNFCQLFEWKDGKLYLPINSSVVEIDERKAEYQLSDTYKIV